MQTEYLGNVRSTYRSRDSDERGGCANQEKFPEIAYLDERQRQERSRKKVARGQRRSEWMKDVLGYQ